MGHNWGQCVSEFKSNLGSVGQFAEGNLDIDHNSCTWNVCFCWTISTNDNFYLGCTLNPKKIPTYTRLVIIKLSKYVILNIKLDNLVRQIYIQ